ncbi:MAG: polysaccharide deacetylase family protein [Pseudomonadales bacterium]
MLSPSFHRWLRNWSRRWLRSAVLGSLALLGSSARGGEESLPPSVVVLQYHFVATDTPASTSVTPAQFAAHLEAIDASGATVLPLAEALEALHAGRTLPETALAITFDDAYESIAEAAHPLLRGRGWPYTIFVNPEPIDRRHGGFLSWDQLRQLATEGVTIGNHGLRHDYMVRGESQGLPAPAAPAYETYLETQVLDAQARSDAELGAQPKLCAYPSGECAPTLQSWLKAQGYAAFGQHSGPLWAGSDPQALPRFPASGIYGELDSLQPKLTMKALAATIESPTSMILPPGTEQPTLRFTLRFPEAHRGPVQCYLSGQGAIPTEREGGQVEAKAPAAPPLGRSRFNCTAQGPGGRWHWLSQPLLRLP